MSLTHEADILVYMSVVVQGVQRYWPRRGYVSWIWLEGMDNDLAWLCPQANTTKHKEYIALSWS